MPTNVTCSDISQSRIASRPAVIDENVRTSVRRRVPGPGTRTHTLTSALLISMPAHR
jgi:hypothetical protein